MNERKSCCGFMVFLTFVVGIIIGLFISPDSGENNRSKIRYRLDSLLDSFKSSMEKFLKYVKTLDLNDDKDKEGETIVKETIDKADQIMNEI